MAGVVDTRPETPKGESDSKCRKEKAIRNCARSPGPHCQTKIMRLKKTAALALAAAMLATSAALPAFAASNKVEYDASATPAPTTTTTTGTTVVKYEVTAKYTWSIPSEIDFGSNAGVNKNVVVLNETKTSDDNTIYRDKNDDCIVKVTQNVIPEGHSLNIKVSSEQYDNTDNTYQVKTENNGSTYLPYTIKKSESGNALGKEAVVLTVPNGTNEGSQALIFTLTTNSTQDASQKIAEVAGKYQDTLTFTATVDATT